MRPAPKTQGASSSGSVAEDQPHSGTAPAFTSLHRVALSIHPASRTSLRLALEIGSGFSRIELIVFLPGVVNGAVPATLLVSGLAQSATAASPADLPSIRASFQTSTVCVPRATRFRAAESPSWPDTGTLPASPWAASAA